MIEKIPITSFSDADKKKFLFKNSVLIEIIYRCKDS